MYIMICIFSEMITDVFIVYDNKEQINKVGDTSKYSPTFHFVDYTTRKGRREALKIKSHYAAKLNPFAVVLDKNTPIKAFYTEAGDVITNLFSYLDEYESKSN